MYFCALETESARKLDWLFRLKCRKGALLCTRDWIYSKERSATPTVVQKSAPFQHLFAGTCYSHDKKSGYVAAAATQELSTDQLLPVTTGRRRPKADHGHAVASSVMCTVVMSLFLLASCRVSGATLKPIKELRMDKERYQTQTAENITPLVPSTYS